MKNRNSSFFRVFSWLIATGVAGIYAINKFGKGVRGFLEEEKEEDLEERRERLIREHKELPVGTVIDEQILEETGLAPFFDRRRLTEKEFRDMIGNSIPSDVSFDKSILRLVRVLYYGFDENTHIGEIVVHRRIADDVIEIFFELYKKRYPIEKMRRIDFYAGDDLLSMSDNNTSGFNYRNIAKTDRLSRHAKGMAIDVNPRYNPYIYTIRGTTYCEPENGQKYADRTSDFEHKITRGDLCCRLFLKHGFEWGGDWKNRKDYQHFEYNKRKGKENG